ncbi:hypothetical protein BDW42DRAFT_170375 [Aspergillus taichungensis]|uniref:Uncharacterized protein n=1 Tax=Aspergillus taichungensis TaxID=482145 RepID=A0A2J5HTS2_9EURO|nr:hypothetical protein BDW42DRAFT_170375 [Aspergillus taichungensis]
MATTTSTIITTCTITATQDSKAPSPRLCMESIGIVLPLLRLVLTLVRIHMLDRMRWFMGMVMVMPTLIPMPMPMPMPVLNTGMKKLGK